METSILVILVLLYYYNRYDFMSHICATYTVSNINIIDIRYICILYINIHYTFFITSI